VAVEATVFAERGIEHYGVKSAADLQRARTAAGTTWVRASDVTDDELDRLAAAYDIHPIENDVRPKVEVFDDHTFVLVKSARLRTGETSFEEEIGHTPIGLFLGDEWLVTLSIGRPEAAEGIRNRVLGEESRLLARGSDFVAYRVLDRIVDGYFGILDEIESDIERVEEAVIAETDPSTIEDINGLRRELPSVRRLVWPSRDAVNLLARGDVDHVDEATEKYFGDIYDGLVQLVELTETYRDLASGARDIYLNTVSQSTNEVMKRLTVVATIILPLTFVVGVYGMNFEDGPYNMPELGWTFGYPAVVVGMAATALVMLAYFRREGWL